MYCVKCGKENKDTDSYCSNCGHMLHETSLQKKELKSTPFFAYMVVSNIIAIFSAMIPILYVYNDYNYEYINVGLWRYLTDFENLIDVSRYQKIFHVIVRYGMADGAKELLLTVFSSVFLAMGVLAYILSVICSLYFLYQILQGVRGKRLANLSSRTMVSGITFFVCLLIYSFIPFYLYSNDGEKPSISVIGFVILIIFLANTIYFEKEYAKREGIGGNLQKDDDKNEKMEKAWGLNTLAQLLVLTILTGIGVITFLIFSLKDGNPYSPLYGWAIDGQWVSEGNGSGHYKNIYVFIDEQYVRLQADGVQCLEASVQKSDDGVGVNYMFWYQNYPFYLNIMPDEIYVEEYMEGESNPFQYHDTLQRVIQ